MELINSISSDDIKFTTLEDTKDGVSDTTYILTDSNNKRYICKLYESASLAEVKRERRLLSLLHGSFCVPSPMFELCKYKNRPLAFYSFIEGKSPQKPNTNQIKKIAKFLARFHTISPKIGRSSEGFYTHKSMKKMLQDAPFEFQKRYKLIKNIPLFCDGLIHGDLFPDNSKFIGDELIGVFDFIDSSVGDFSFDLAVVANSWCENDINTLLDSYNSFAPKSVSKNSLLNMMKFAALFYALQRLHSGTKDYREYLAKFDFINN